MWTTWMDRILFLHYPIARCLNFWTEPRSASWSGHMNHHHRLPCTEQEMWNPCLLVLGKEWSSHMQIYWRGLVSQYPTNSYSCYFYAAQAAHTFCQSIVLTSPQLQGHVGAGREEIKSKSHSVWFWRQAPPNQQCVDYVTFWGKLFGKRFSEWWWNLRI